MADEGLWTAARIFRDLQKKGGLLSDNDLWIAATAVVARYPFVTDNARRFRRIRGLKVLSHRD